MWPNAPSVRSTTASMSASLGEVELEWQRADAERFDRGGGLADRAGQLALFLAARAHDDVRAFRASRSASTLPMPRELPVTIATLPASALPICIFAQSSTSVRGRV